MDPSPEMTRLSRERFLKFTVADGECIVWIASKSRGGYGQFNAGKVGDRKVIAKAHRFAWIAQNGPIPPGQCICHRCDNPSCVNPDHLFLGSHGDNNRDMFSKGRGYILDGSHIRGARNRRTKLTEDQVAEIRRRAAEGEMGKVIAERFGVTPANVSSILCGKTWPMHGVVQNRAQDDRFASENSGKNG